MSQLNNNIFKHIKDSSGVETLNTVRKYEKVVNKLARFKNHLTFAIRCKDSRVQPKGLRLKHGMKSQKARRIIESTERKLLHEHIYKTVRTIDDLKSEKRHYEERLAAILNEEVFARLKEIIEKKEKTEYEKVKNRQKKKFSKLTGLGD